MRTKRTRVGKGTDFFTDFFYVQPLSASADTILNQFLLMQCFGYLA